MLSERKIAKRLSATIILAEKAQQLYRDTAYADLISFEEDIARLSTLVLVIAESPGSLAELGAFASLKSLREKLAIIIKSEHYNRESFVRYGPVQRLQNENEDRVASYPWRNNGRGRVVKTTIKPHYQPIVDFINACDEMIPEEEFLEENTLLKPYIYLCWISHLSNVITFDKLVQYYRSLGFVEQEKDIRNRLYCMLLAGWMRKQRYGNTDYYFNHNDIDPFSRYRFRDGVAVVDRYRRKLDVTASIQADLKIRHQVLRLLQNEWRAEE